MATTTCPVFYPSEAEFSDFNAYIQFLETCMPSNAGICKVVPPATWPKPHHNDPVRMNQVAIEEAVQQQITGGGGVFKVNLFDRKEKWTVASFRDFSLQLQCDHPCLPSDYDDDYQEAYNHAELVEAREKRFWKQLLNCNSGGPVYGADVPGGFFTGNAPII
ncbi:hypothetical protein EON65_50135 [archaeon]|nr:MAG: hypothetical protein EON65_50135 [archaeon]